MSPSTTHQYKFGTSDPSACYRRKLGSTWKSLTLEEALLSLRLSWCRSVSFVLPFVQQMKMKYEVDFFITSDLFYKTLFNLILRYREIILSHFELYFSNFKFVALFIDGWDTTHLISLIFSCRSTLPSCQWWTCTSHLLLEFLSLLSLGVSLSPLLSPWLLTSSPRTWIPWISRIKVMVIGFL